MLDPPTLCLVFPLSLPFRLLPHRLELKLYKPVHLYIRDSMLLLCTDRLFVFIRYILNYLRNGDLLCPEDRTVRKELLAEATFYQVQGVINHLKEKMSAFECSSIIETENHHSALISWLPPYATCSLLFRASDDGKMPADFHRCCDNKGPTLVLIKSEEYIFGGYTVQSWDSGT